MSLANKFGVKNVSSGMLSEGVLPSDLSVAGIISFIKKQLPRWSVDQDTPKNVAEPRLNTSLCNFLSDKSRIDLPLCNFTPEVLQRDRRRIDFVARPTEHIYVEGYKYTKNDPIFIIECKRLPVPKKNREREYVTGNNGEITGGIQRFKLGEHGGKHTVAAMVGYVHKNSFPYWFEIINTWIDELIRSDDNNNWEESDKLEDFVEEPEIAHLISHNGRDIEKCKSDTILLHHLWVLNM